MDPSACLVTEDSKNGILSGRAAGCAVVGITTSFKRDDLKEAGADYVVDSYPELASGLELESRRG
jgi:beta-phosphoglucomutase-like phosphatase (HAD superfamily)